MAKRLLPGLILALFLALIWAAFFWEPVLQDADDTAPQEALSMAPPGGGGFELRSSLGPVTLELLRGKVVTLYFGYTKCPDICPTSMGYLGLALNELSPDELAQVQALFISVDPERDTLERLKSYGEYFHPGILGVTGSAEEIAVVAEKFGAGYRRVEQLTPSSYTIDHTSDIYVIDREGELVERLAYGLPPGKILDALRNVLRPVEE
ncbi:MAG: SCO family protein [Gammaproteobacteria bacterium]|nr:SCO family protein [Gammaproteobacteria bacterium]